MEIKTLIQKLEPLLADQVARWRYLLDFAEPDVKKLIETQIRLSAHKVLGSDFREKILLSLPPKQTIKGSLHLGTILYEKEKWPAALTTNELMQNLAIFGRSGAGKTNVAFQLLEQLEAKRIPFLFLDWKRTARHLIPLLGKQTKLYTPGRKLSPFPFNPLIVPPGSERSVYLNHVVDLLATAYTLGDGAKSILHKALASCYAAQKQAPSFRDLLQAIEAMPTKARATGWKTSAYRAIETVELSGNLAYDEESQQELAKSLLHQNTILELDGLSQNSKKFLIPLLCFWIYSVQLAGKHREKLQFVIILEEAHHTLYRQEQRANETLMNMLFRQCRELGMSFVVVDQQPHLISSAALGNCFTTICLNQKDPAAINKAAGLSQVTDTEKHYFSMLAVGQGIVKLQDRWRRPFLVQFPLSQVQKGMVTDALLGQLLNGELTLSALRKRLIGVSNLGLKSRKRGGGGSVGGERFRRAVDMEDGALTLLDDVLQYPDGGVGIRYDRLGISVDRGNRWKLQLIENDLVSSAHVKVGRTYRVLLRPTDAAKRLLLDQNGIDPRASMVHEYWKQLLADRFSGLGYQVALESRRIRSNGMIDVLATKASERVAIEVETGKSDVVSNVKRDLLEGVQHVLVVATDEGAREKVERQLAVAGLLLPRRVQVVSRDGMQAVE